MSHVRQQIRDRVAVDLAGVATVHKTRVWPVQEAALPVLLVYTSNEEAELSDMTSLERRLQVVVEVVAQAATVDTEVDDLIADVETAIANDITLNGLCVACLLTAIEVAVSVEGKSPIGRARMTYVAQYRTLFAAPETPH